jgi:hypothetical protein
LDLCFDSIQVLNRIPKKGESESPYEKFSGFRAEWREPITVKKPKQLSSNLQITGQWAVVVRCMMDNSGILKVYIIQTKKYAYRLQFRQAIAPDWVIESLNNIDINATIGFEDGVEIPIAPDQLPTDIVTTESDKNNLDKTIEVNDLWQEEYPTEEHNMVIMQAIDTIEEVLDLPQEEEENNDIMVTDVMNPGADAVLPIEEQLVYRTRSGRAVRKPSRLIEEAYATVKDEIEVIPQNAMIEIVGMLKAILYERALKKKPAEAKQALLDEVQKALKIDIWEPVFMTQLTAEQKKLIIPMMKNFLEKY